MRRLAWVMMLVPATALAQHEGHAAGARPGARPPTLGTVSFPNSGAAAAQEPFLRGLALLHSFEYEDAAAAFQAARRADPAFAVPVWAEALTHSHVLWGEEDAAAARAALVALGATPAERLAHARTPRERAFGAAVEALYAEGAQPARVRGFADATRQWATEMPGDHEAAVFAALGELWQSYLTRDDSAAAALAGEAARRAETVYAANPRHPGAAHYMIHAYDSPAGAARGLAAARAYARIAPGAEHALHMPSHIFLPLGMWDEMADSNERAWVASRGWAGRGGRPAWEADWHDANWLQYAYLQQGRWRAARALVDTARVLAAEARRNPADDRGDAAFALEQLAFRYGSETGRWDAFPPDSIAVSWRDPALSARTRTFALNSVFQRAAAALLARGDTVPAANAVRALRDAARAGDANPLVERAAGVLEAMVMDARGGRAAGIAALEARRAASAVPRNRSMQPPARLVVEEILAGRLLAAGRARDAAAGYAHTLESYPNRAAALLGLARARTAAGDAAGAREAYARLAAVWRHADADLPALAEVRRGSAARTASRRR